MTIGDHAGRQGEQLQVLDLFAGCGGFSAGFRSYAPEGARAPVFRTVAAVEWDKAAAATFAVNHPDADVLPLDIQDFAPPVSAGSVDVITGGPPCQGFSGLGPEDPDDPRNKLWQDYMRIVVDVQPKVFVMENVDRFLRSSQFSQLVAAARDGALRDYALTAKILNAADYGVPQARRRALVIGTRRDLPPLEHPQPTHAKLGVTFPDQLFGSLPPWKSVRSIFQRSAQLGRTVEAMPERTCAPLGHDVPGAFRTDELHVGRTPVPLSMARYAAIHPGGNRKDLRGKWAQINGECVYLSTESWDRHNSGSGDVMGRLHADRPSVTIRTEFFKPEKGRYLHPVENRPITHYEAALIQGFPDDYLWCGSKIQIARQIGNAVPVGLSRALAGAIYQHLGA
ncbi:DNA cytosine methyltransferase [Streptomyces sp. NPDC001667]